jgi:hypothetical protein
VSEYVNGIPPQYRPNDINCSADDDTNTIILSAYRTLKHAQWPLEVGRMMVQRAIRASNKQEAVNEIKMYVNLSGWLEREFYNVITVEQGLLNLLIKENCYAGSEI